MALKVNRRKGNEAEKKFKDGTEKVIFERKNHKYDKALHAALIEINRIIFSAVIYGVTRSGTTMMAIARSSTHNEKTKFLSYWSMGSKE
jgi:hypothetical protein